MIRRAAVLLLHLTAVLVASSLGSGCETLGGDRCLEESDPCEGPTPTPIVWASVSARVSNAPPAFDGKSALVAFEPWGGPGGWCSSTAVGSTGGFFVASGRGVLVAGYPYRVDVWLESSGGVWIPANLGYLVDASWTPGPIGDDWTIDLSQLVAYDSTDAEAVFQSDLAGCSY